MRTGICNECHTWPLACILCPLYVTYSLKEGKWCQQNVWYLWIWCTCFGTLIFTAFTCIVGGGWNLLWSTFSHIEYLLSNYLVLEGIKKGDRFCVLRCKLFSLAYNSQLVAEPFCVCMHVNGVGKCNIDWVFGNWLVVLGSWPMGSGWIVNSTSFPLDF